MDIIPIYMKEEIKYGVPSLETCMKLDWAKDTTFLWFTVQDAVYGLTPDKHYLCIRRPQLSKLIVVKYDLMLSYSDSQVPAPQMHEIAAELPKVDVYIANGVAILYNTDGTQKLKINVSNNNYAEAYARIYIHLKNK